MEAQTVTVTLEFVAQSGNVWEETVSADDIDSTIEQAVATHGDIEKVYQLDSEGSIDKTLWRME